MSTPVKRVLGEEDIINLPTSMSEANHQKKVGMRGASAGGVVSYMDRRYVAFVVASTPAVLRSSSNSHLCVYELRSGGEKRT